MNIDYFVHNGYLGMSHGTPGNPQLISSIDAQKLMELAGLSIEQVSKDFPPPQFAEKVEPLFLLFGSNRFIQYLYIPKCGDVQKRKVSKPLNINWNKT